MISVANLLFIYLFVTILAAVFLFFNVYHLSRYGLNDQKTYFLIGTYITLYLLLLIFSAIWLSSFDWSASVSGNLLNGTYNTIPGF